MAEMKMRHVGATLALMAALFWNPFTSPLNAQSAVGGKSAAIEVITPRGARTLRYRHAVDT